MKPDITPAIATPAETQWVEAELVRNLMRVVQNTQLVGVLLIPVFVGVLFDDNEVEALTLWTACGLAMAALRSWVVRKYVREVMAAGARAQLAFFDKYRLVWPVSAFVWGASTLLFFDRSPLADPAPDQSGPWGPHNR